MLFSLFHEFFNKVRNFFKCGTQAFARMCWYKRYLAFTGCKETNWRYAYATACASTSTFTFALTWCISVPFAASIPEAHAKFYYRHTRKFAQLK